MKKLDYVSKNVKFAGGAGRRSVCSMSKNRVAIEVRLSDYTNGKQSFTREELLKIYKQIKADSAEAKRKLILATA